MLLPPPHVREAGDGPGVVCLHSNASTSAQWRALMERLAPTFRVLAADSWGAGRSPAWPTDRTIGLADEAALLAPVFASAGDPFALVGHSYGGAIAVVTALTQPGRVRALAVYEPTLFSLLDERAPRPNEGEGIRLAVDAAAEALARGDRSGAAECFIDYWMGAGAWARTPENRRGPIADSMINIVGWGRSLTDAPVTLAQLSRLDVPVLLMTGKESPISARAVARLLKETLPRVETLEFEGLGHMGPITHPQVVNEAVAAFLERR